MNTRLLSVFLLFCSIAFGQIPTSGLQRAYDFTNGSLMDAANGENLTQNGTTLSTVDDRFSTTNNGISINGDNLSSSNFGFTDISISFWIKTDINDGNERTILDKSNRTGASFSFTGPASGFFLFLKDGKIGFKVARRTILNTNTSQQGYPTSSFLFSEFIANDTWRQVTITIKKEGTQFNTSSGRNTYPFSYKFYVDDVLEQTSLENVEVGGIFSSQGINTAANFTVGNNQPGNLTAANVFSQSVDDIYIYNRVLSAAEVSQITTDNSYTVCETPDIADFSTTNITDNSATLVVPQTDTFDVAYGLSSQPFNTYTIVSDVNGNVAINNLDLSSEYTVQYRTKCNGNTTYNASSGWSFPTLFRTTGPLFVNQNAAGLNDGSSWANGYTSLQDALTNVIPDGEIWVTSGTYKPDATNRGISFTVTEDNVKLYGGFSGTETSIYERNTAMNETILSGDLLGNDNSTIDFGESTRSDNTQHIIRLDAHNAVIDGFTISNGHTMGSSNEVSAAIYSTISNPLGFSVNNCIIKNNVADNGAFFTFSSQFAYSSVDRNVRVTNTIVENNLSRYGTINFRSTNAENTIATLYNCLFKDNVVKDRPGTAGFAGSVVWAVSNSIPNRLTITLDIINCTAINNQDLGTNSALNNFTRSPIMVGENTSTMITDVSNTILWNNTTVGGNPSRAVSTGTSAATGTILVSNSISNNNFSNIASGDKVNTSNTDPLFTSATNFTLQANSPAIDAGDNSKLPTPLNIDLAGNNRIFNTTVDMGVYEFGSGTFKPTLTLTAVDGSVTTNPNPTNGTYDFGESVQLTPVPNAGFEFTGWSGDLSGNTVNEQVVMDSNKAITATFAPIQRTLTVNSVGGNIAINPAPVNGTYDNGTVVTVTATATAGFMFDSWSGDATGNSNPLMITMDGDKVITANYLKNRVFVDKNATGANDGTSWADAYTSLSAALAANPITDFWIKAETYIPGSSRNDTFVVAANQTLYGGFNGTETQLSERNPTMNVTILSGDINGNDAGSVNQGNATHNDNSYNVVNLQGENATIDGLTITSGKANGSNAVTQEGANVFVNSITVNGRITNCKITNGIASRGGSGLRINALNTSSIIVTNTIFDGNVANFAPHTYVTTDAGTLNTTFINCVFSDGLSEASSGTSSEIAGIWFRNDSNAINISEFTNCTFTGHRTVNNAVSVPKLVVASRIAGTVNITMNNSIFWDNVADSGNELTAIGTATGQNGPQSVSINNCLEASGFSNWTIDTNTVTMNPMFANTATGNYTLTTGSPAIDAGNNSFLSASIVEDLNGNNRIVGGTIDIGAYEFDPTLSTEDVSFSPLEFTIYPNPAKATLNIQTTENIQTVTVFDMTGKQILKTNETKIDVRRLQSGMYILQVTSNQKNSTKRFMKQ